MEIEKTKSAELVAVEESELDAVSGGFAFEFTFKKVEFNQNTIQSNGDVNININN